MRTAIVLGESYLALLDPAALAPCRVVAIVGEHATLPPRPRLDAVYRVPSRRAGALGELDESAARAAVATELARGPDRVGIVCAEEGNVYIAARLRDAFGIPGVGADQATLLRDKVAMKGHLATRGLRVPRHVRLTERATFDALAAELGVPFIVKPVSEGAAYGVVKVTVAADMPDGAARGDLAYEAEEFIEGRLFHVDTLVERERIVFAECAELTWPALDYLAGRPVGSLPVPPDNPLRARLLDFATTALAALGLPSGAAHTEIFVTPSGELVFLELGGRIPGALIVPMYERAHGINLLTLDAQIQLGIPITWQRVQRTHCCWAIFPGARGRVASVAAPPLESPHQLDWLVAPGDVIGSGSSLFDRVATIVAWNDDYATLRRDFDRLRAHTAVTVA